MLRFLVCIEKQEHNDNASTPFASRTFAKMVSGRSLVFAAGILCQDGGWEGGEGERLCAFLAPCHLASISARRHVISTGRS